MFRRSKSAEQSDVDPAPVKPGGKGRPTPSRKDAEAAARARAKVPRTRKELAARQRQVRSESSRQMREALKGGDPRYLPARDQGPVKAMIRDLVDSRYSLTELLVPMMLVTLILGSTQNTRLIAIGNAVLLTTIVLVAAEMVGLRFRVRREMRNRFPDESLKGTTYYAVVRGLQMRFMRLPKAQIKRGTPLPEKYR